jgi:hypothetical protein
MSLPVLAYLKYTLWGLKIKHINIVVKAVSGLYNFKLGTNIILYILYIL